MHSRRQGYEPDRIDSHGPGATWSDLSLKRERLTLAFWTWRQLALHVMLTAVAIGVVADCLHGRPPMMGELVELLSSFG